MLSSLGVRKNEMASSKVTRVDFLVAVTFLLCEILDLLEKVGEKEMLDKEMD
jgi:hypothetical protein